MHMLVVKLADLGDLLVSEPALRSLRGAFPDATIDVLTTPRAAELLPHLDPRATPITFEKAVFDAPGLDAALSAGNAARLAARLRLTRYDRVIFLHHLTTRWGTAKYRALALASGARLVAGLDNGRGDFLTHRVIDRGFGFKREAEYMLDVAMVAGGARVEAVPRFQIHDQPFADALPDGYVAVAPGAGEFSRARIWPTARFVVLSRELARTGLSIVVVGGSDAHIAGAAIVDAIGTGRALDLTGKTSINETAIVLEKARAIVGNDSFPAHLGAAVGTPVVTIFGPSNLDAWKPAGCRSIALTSGLPCSPCLYTGYRLGRREGCPSRTCLDLVTPEMVLEATLELVGA